MINLTSARVSLAAHVPFFTADFVYILANEGRDANDRLWGDFAVYLHKSAMMSADLLRVSVSLTRKLQRTFCTSLAWRNPFPLTTTWKDSEADSGFQNKSPPTWFHRVCMFRVFTSFADAGGLDSQDLNAGSLQDLRVKIWNCSSGVTSHSEGWVKNSSARLPYRVNDALQGLETIVDRKDVLLAVRYGRELQRNVTKSRFIALQRHIFNKPSAGSPVSRWSLSGPRSKRWRPTGVLGQPGKRTVHK